MRGLPARNATIFCAAIGAAVAGSVVAATCGRTVICGCVQKVVVHQVRSPSEIDERGSLGQLREQLQVEDARGRRRQRQEIEEDLGLRQHALQTSVSPGVDNGRIVARVLSPGVNAKAQRRKRRTHRSSHLSEAEDAYGAAARHALRQLPPRCVMLLAQVGRKLPVDEHRRRDGALDHRLRHGGVDEARYGEVLRERRVT